MFDIGRVGYKIKNDILIPNIELISSSVAERLGCEFTINNGSFFLTGIKNSSNIEVAESVTIVIRTILYGNIQYITNNCMGYSLYKTEKDAIEYIDTYAGLLYTCLQISPTIYSIILV